MLIGASRIGHVTPNVQLAPGLLRGQFKVIVMTYKVLCGFGPEYQKEHLRYVPSYWTAISGFHHQPKLGWW